MEMDNECCKGKFSKKKSKNFSMAGVWFFSEYISVLFKYSQYKYDLISKHSVYI